MKEAGELRINTFKTSNLTKHSAWIGLKKSGSRTARGEYIYVSISACWTRHHLYAITLPDPVTMLVNRPVIVLPPNATPEGG